jgi:hypothetical protein
LRPVIAHPLLNGLSIIPENCISVNISYVLFSQDTHVPSKIKKVTPNNNNNNDDDDDDDDNNNNNNNNEFVIIVVQMQTNIYVRSSHLDVQIWLLVLRWVVINKKYDGTYEYM